jgi:hypothetical protein
MVASGSHPTKLEVNFDTRIISSAINIFGGTKDFILVQALALAKIKTFSGGVINMTPFHTTIKDERIALVVGTSMEGETSIFFNV